MYVHLHICMYEYVHTHVEIQILKYIHVHVWECMHLCTCKYVYACVFTFIWHECTYVYTSIINTWIYTCIHTCLWIKIYTHIDTCMYVYVHVHTIIDIYLIMCKYICYAYMHACVWARARTRACALCLHMYAGHFFPEWVTSRIKNTTNASFG